MADVEITPASVLSTPPAPVTMKMAGEHIVAGDMVHLVESTDRAVLASADDEYRVYGMALNEAWAGQPLAIHRGGMIDVGGGLEAGATYYLSVEPGKLCLESDLLNDDYASLVGVAFSSSVLSIRISAPAQYKGVAPPLRVVATRGEVQAAYTSAARVTTNVAQRMRWRIYAGKGGIKAGKARLCFNAFLSLNDAEEDMDGYVVRAHIEVGGVAYPCGFNGAASGVVPAGAAEYLSDPIAAMPEVAAGAEMWLLVYRLYQVGDEPHYVASQAPSPAITDEAFQTANASIDPGIGTPGPIASGGGWNTNTRYISPVVVLGEPVTPGRSIVVVGASIERGQADTWGDGANGAGGYIRRGLVPASGDKYAYISLARATEDTTKFLDNSAKRSVYFKYADVALMGYGGNDYTNNATKENTLARMILIMQALLASGSIDKVGFVRMVTKTNSIDSWETTTNQSIRLGFDTFRDYIDQGVVAAGMTLLDLSGGYEQSGMPSIWKANGTPQWSTTDGTHPSAIRHGDAAVLLQAAMSTFVP